VIGIRGRISAIERFDEPLDVDDVPEFHAARLLLLLRFYGRSPGGEIAGRTKLAKLDFFVRYPRFLEAAVARLRSEGRDVPEYHVQPRKHARSQLAGAASVSSVIGPHRQRSC
jgi:hypothetical protein